MLARRCLLISALSIVVACSSNTAGDGPFFTTSAPTTTTSTTSTTTTSTLPPTTTSTLPPTTTTLPPVTEGGVVMVANATDIDDAAQKLTDELAELGFTMEDPTNSAGKDETLTLSKIYVISGSEPVAESVSYLMGGIPIFRMTTPAWISAGTAGLGDATVLVMLGSDLAGEPLLMMRFEPGRQGPD